MARLADKPLAEYWGAVRIPAIALSVWIIASLVVSLVDFELYWSFFTSPWLGYVLPIVAYGAAGYIMIACRPANENRHAAWAGALVGIITGLVSAVASIIMMGNTPLIERTIAETVASMPPEAAVDPVMLKEVMTLWSYVGIVLTPLISGLFGALFGWLGGLISRKVECGIESEAPDEGSVSPAADADAGKRAKNAIRKKKAVRGKKAASR